MKAPWRFLVCLAFPLVACGSAEEPATPNPTPAPAPNPPDFLISAPTADGGRIEGQLGGDVQTPAGFPKDVPLYPGAELTASGSASGQGLFLMLGSPDAPDPVYRFYHEQLQAEGWSFSSELWLNGFGLLSAEKGDRFASVSVTGQDDHTIITLTVKLIEPD